MEFQKSVILTKKRIDFCPPPPKKKNRKFNFCQKCSLSFKKHKNENRISF